MKDDLTPTVDTQPFVGREDVKKIFADQINSISILGHEPLVFWGVGGVGKTALRETLAKASTKKNGDGLQIPFAICEVDAREFASLRTHVPLKSFVDSLKKFGIPFSEFRPLYPSLWKSQEYFPPPRRSQR